MKKQPLARSPPSWWRRWTSALTDQTACVQTPGRCPIRDLLLLVKAERRNGSETSQPVLCGTRRIRLTRDFNLPPSEVEVQK